MSSSPSLRATVLTVVGLGLAAVVAVGIVTTVDQIPVDIWNACRGANKYIGYAVALLVFIRLADMGFDPARWRDARARHLMFWFAYIAASLIVASAGAAHYEAIDAPANWTSGARTALSAAAIVLSLWWPHPRKFTPIEEADSARDA